MESLTVSPVLGRFTSAGYTAEHQILTRISSDFYSAYDSHLPMDKGKLPMDCDVEVSLPWGAHGADVQLIIPEIQARVFADCSFVFSGVIPRQQDPTTWVRLSEYL